MKWGNLFRGIVLLLAATVLFACGSSGGGGSSDDGVSSAGGDTGTVSVGLTDNSTYKYKAVYVTIKEVQFNRKDRSSDHRDRGWEVFARPNKTYNLLRLVNGVSETLGDQEFPVGHYKQIRLIIGKTPESENNNEGEPHPYANYVVLKDGSYVPLKIPSGLQTGIKLVHNFVVERGKTVELLLDFDACRSVVEAGKSGKFILKPTIKVIRPIDKSVVFGTVTDASDDQPIGGANVSAQISDGFSATIVRSTLTDSGEEFADEKGNYELLLSPTQSYSVVVFSSEIITGSQMYDPACANVNAPWKDAERNFALRTTDLGTISGEVFVNGEIEDPDVAVYVTIYRDLACGYVEVTTLPVSPDPEDDNRITYSVDLPLGNYDIVASAECFIPDSQFNVQLLNPVDNIADIDLTITPRNSCD